MTHDSLDERIAAARRRRAAVAAEDRAGLDARLIELASRWEHADGLGPLPGEAAARKALDRGQLTLARRALAVAGIALRRRESAHLQTQVPTPPLPAESTAEPELAGLLGELSETGRPVRALEPEERARLETSDPSAALTEVPNIRRRIRLESRRVRLLFDLQRLAPVLPEVLVSDLRARADREDPTDLREELLSALEERQDRG